MTASDENLIGYLLQALDPETHQDVESYLRADPEGQKRIELLRQALAPLVADRDGEPPPDDLAIRTLARVAEHGCRHLPRAPELGLARVGGAGRPWWRRADLLVAAGILLAFIGLGLPGLLQLRYRSALLSCQNNLRLFHNALVQYGDQHEGKFPHVQERERRNFAGIYVPALHEAGVLDQQASARCPANGARQLAGVTLQELDRMPTDRYLQYAADAGGCYAYSLGYRDRGPEGQVTHYGYGSHDSAFLPIMADRPHIRGDLGSDVRGNSPNHGGGQNVLFIGGHVRYCTDTGVGVDGDHIYLNQASQARAGRNQRDTVLGVSGDRP